MVLIFDNLSPTDFLQWDKPTESLQGRKSTDKFTVPILTTFIYSTFNFRRVINMISLSDSLSYAANYTKGLLSRIGDLLILTIISIIPIVNFIAWGYYGRVVKDGSASKEPPKLEKYGDMFVGGLMIFVAGIIWAIPIIIVSALIMIPLFGFPMLSRLDLLTTPDLLANPATWVFLMLPALAVVWVIGFFVGIVALMGIIHMFKTGSFGKAFAIGEILNIIGKIGWLRYLAWLVVSFVLVTVIAAFSWIPFVGWIIGIFLSVLLVIFLARSIGIMYDGAMGATTAPATPTASPPPPPPQAPTA